MSITAIVAISCVVLFFVFYGMYTNVIKAKNKVEEAYSGIDVQLKKKIRFNSKPFNNCKNLYGTRKRSVYKNYRIKNSSS